ncbi:hypothetical protein QZH41_001354 [Actinostola sp. cb2023]|nr:hypothetical protein QZH41_001354 [Actinostola sp. cb2023]
MMRHEQFADHKSAIQAVELKDNFDAAFAKANSQEDEAVIKALKVVYWLASENLPMSKYESLMQLLKELEVPKIECLKVNNRIDYESYYTANELLSAISSQIDEELDKKIEKSPVVTVLADESTDISNTKRMTIHARIVDPTTSVPETIYLRDVEYDDGTGEGLTNTIMHEMGERNISSTKLLGFGSDGAAVMSGSNKGVKGRPLERNGHLVHVHCMAHRLALCTSQAANNIPKLKKYQEWLTSLFYYLKGSASREKELHVVQEILDHPKLKYKEIHAVRWLSCYEAVDAVYRTLDPLITYFHGRRAEKDPKSKGLLKYIASNEFIYTTYLMMDVLPIVSRLCLQFQARDLDVAKAKVSLDHCLADLNAYRNGKQMFKTHIEEYGKDISTVDNHLEFKGHIVASKLTDTSAIVLKNEFLDHLIVNIQDRFPQRSLLNNFYVLGMRTINFDKDPDTFGNKEIEELLQHFGEEKLVGGVNNAPPRKTFRNTLAVLQSMAQKSSSF